jgi:hypothetical protein
MPLEILYFPLVFLRGLAIGEGAEVAAVAVRVRLAGIKAILAGSEFTDHGDTPVRTN